MSSISKAVKTQLFNFQFLIANIQKFQLNASYKYKCRLSSCVVAEDTDRKTDKVKRGVTTAGGQEKLSVERKNSAGRTQV